ELAYLLLPRHVPDTDRPVPTSRSEGLTVRREGHGVDRPLGACQLEEVLAGRWVPEADGTVPTAEGHAPAGRGEPEGVGLDRRPLPAPEFLAGRGRPEAYRLVLAHRDDVLAVGRDGDAAHRPPVPEPGRPQAGHGMRRQGVVEGVGRAPAPVCRDRA